MPPFFKVIVLPPSAPHWRNVRVLRTEKERERERRKSSRSHSREAGSYSVTRVSASREQARAEQELLREREAKEREKMLTGAPHQPNMEESCSSSFARARTDKVETDDIITLFSFSLSRFPM